MSLMCINYNPKLYLFVHKRELKKNFNPKRLF